MSTLASAKVVGQSCRTKTRMYPTYSDFQMSPLTSPKRTKPSALGPQTANGATVTDGATQPWGSASAINPTLLVSGMASDAKSAKLNSTAPTALSPAPPWSMELPAQVTAPAGMARVPAQPCTEVSAVISSVPVKTHSHATVMACVIPRRTVLVTVIPSMAIGTSAAAARRASRATPVLTVAQLAQCTKVLSVTV